MQTVPRGKILVCDLFLKSGWFPLSYSSFFPIGEAQKDKKIKIFAVARQPGYHGDQVASMTSKVEVPWGTNIEMILSFLYFL